MGLRDRLKDAAKRVLAGPGPAPAPARPPAPSAPSAGPASSSSLPSQQTADGFRAVAPSAKVAEGGAGTFPVGGAVVAVFRYQGRLFAIDNACAHEDGPVGEGAIRGNCVRCPYHDWEYDFTTGACRTDPERALATYAVRERDGFVWVGPRLTEGTGARGGDHNDGLETITR